MKCEDIGFGTYDCAYNIMVPWLCKHEWEDESQRKPKYVAVDKCLMREILDLWERGIKTTGCCCGHGRKEPFIGVQDQFVEQMKSLGYAHRHNSVRPDDDTEFYPKTKIVYGTADKGLNWWDNSNS